MHSVIFDNKKILVDSDRPLEIMDSLSSGISSFSLFSSLFWSGLGSSITGGVVTVTQLAKNEKKCMK